MKPSYLNIPHIIINQCAETVEFILVYINFTREKQREKYNSFLKNTTPQEEKKKDAFYPVRVVTRSTYK